MSLVDRTHDTDHGDAVERRGLIQKAGLVAAMGALAVGGTAATSTPAEAQGITDIDILNFALNLEYLEAEYYLRAVTGQGLSAADTNGPYATGGVIGGSLVPFNVPIVAEYAANLAIDEQAHVRFLRSALGSAAIPRPNIDLQSSFTNLAIFAGLIRPGQTFNPFADQTSFLLGAYIFEDVGVTAYAGAAALITNKDYLAAAASILAIEAYHAGNIRTLLANIGAGAATNAISAARARASGAADDQGTLKPTGRVNTRPADDFALAFRRTPRQVLNIVYLGGATSGGFFPDGMSGTIRS